MYSVNAREIDRAIYGIRKWQKENPEDALPLAPTLAALEVLLQRVQQHLGQPTKPEGTAKAG